MPPPAGSASGARDARSAAASYDGREPGASLCNLTTLPLLDAPGAGIFTPPGVDAGLAYIEMVPPNDVARRIRLEPSEA